MISRGLEYLASVERPVRWRTCAQRLLGAAEWKMKPQHWRGFRSIFAPKGAPNGVLRFRVHLETSNIRHSSAGWNPVLRIFKHLDGLGPSLRWDDAVFRSPPYSTSRWIA